MNVADKFNSELRLLVSVESLKKCWYINLADRLQYEVTLSQYKNGKAYLQVGNVYDSAINNTFFRKWLS